MAMTRQGNLMEELTTRSSFGFLARTLSCIDGVLVQEEQHGALEETACGSWLNDKKRGYRLEGATTL